MKRSLNKTAGFGGGYRKISLRALFRDDQVVMQPTMIILPTLPTLLSLLSSPSRFGLKRHFYKLSFSFLSREILTDTSVPPQHLFV